ncbi:MAG: CHRD domain-containing protein [Gemmatimonadetes bacterium]|nr:CHRD domain-containing protein [Gemmatimonadota bacterium]NNM04968.1 CHRD domain-containing protein [Gemmatimonadota bacterium]
MAVSSSKNRSRWIFLPGLVALAVAQGACNSPDAMAPESPAFDLQAAVGGAPSERALEVKSTFVASLSGTSAGAESKGAGEAVFQFDQGGEVIRFRLNVANINNVTMAHIHVATEPGGNGPPVVWLYPDGPPPALISGRTQGGLAFGEFSDTDLVGPLTGMTLADLRLAFVEGRAYVNVHTSQHPGGEIRGAIG